MVFRSWEVLVVNDGGPAFPHFVQITLPDDTTDYRPATGMSLRDHFAGQALLGLIACPGTGSDHMSEATVAKSFAQISYLYADALLAERAK